MENEEKKILKVPTYTRKAIQRYQEKNKEKISQKHKDKYENNEDFRERKKRQALERYYRKKEMNKLNDLK